MDKIKVGIVNYLNTAPLVYGLQNGPISDEIDLIPDYPSNLARYLTEGLIDVGLVPVAAIPDLANWSLVGDYCIGSDGPVGSVCIFSDVPIERVTRVLLDYQSRTSVELAKLLLRDYWKLKPDLEEATDGYRSRIGGTVAGLVIGDRSFEQRLISAYSYDLGEAWKLHTGQAFVYAAWISNTSLPPEFLSRFNEANAKGLANLDDVIRRQAYSLFDLKKYYTEHISYLLDDRKKRGLATFLHNFAPNSKYLHG